MSLSAFAVPVLLDTNQDASHVLRQWARMYHYGHIYLPALCVATCGLYGCAALTRRWQDAAAGPAGSKGRNGGWIRYALAAVATGVMVPFTWYVMVPTNNTLFRLGAPGSEAVPLELVRGLVVRWAWLHVARSLTPLVGALLGFSTLVRELAA